MIHPLCDACETAAWCKNHGCLPIQDEPPYTADKVGRNVAYVLLAAIVLLMAGGILLSLYFGVMPI